MSKHGTKNTPEQQFRGEVVHRLSVITACQQRSSSMILYAWTVLLRRASLRWPSPWSSCRCLRGSAWPRRTCVAPVSAGWGPAKREPGDPCAVVPRYLQGKQQALWRESAWPWEPRGSERLEQHQRPEWRTACAQTCGDAVQALKRPGRRPFLQAAAELVSVPVRRPVLLPPWRRGPLPGSRGRVLQQACAPQLQLEG